jgi:predicted lipid-binding transport protein (Tim44 family)
MFGRNAAPDDEPITIGSSDYDEFEKLLTQVQGAYSQEDEVRLRTLATSEMVGYFAEQQQEYESRGLVNRVSDVRFLNGDLSEAWREGTTDYATVAMQFELTDRVINRANGQTVEGGQPETVTEMWTFTRSRGGHWLLSAIQQT